MISLRAARSTDAGKVGAILSEFVGTTEWMPKLHTGAEDIAHSADMIALGWVTVAEDAGRVVGFSACNEGELNALYVAQAARGHGVGAALLGSVQEGAAKVTLWTFQANTRAQAFYERHGFKEVSRSDGALSDEKLPDVCFEWQREGA